MAIDHGDKKTSDFGGPTGEALDQLLGELEKKIDRVRTLYEQYFMGIEKMEPLVARKECTRMILGMAQQHIRNTGQRFRFHSLQQKWNIYVTYWNRTMREIEAGTYKRDVARVTRKYEREGIVMPEEAALELRVGGRRRRRSVTAPTEAGPAGSPAQAAPAVAPTPSAGAVGPGRAPAPTAPGLGTPPLPGRSAVPTPGLASPLLPVRSPAVTPSSPGRSPARTPMPTPQPPPGMTEPQMRDLYFKYIEAKRRLGETSSQNIKYEALVATVSKQTPQIMQKFGCGKVEFDVVVKEGKVVLKPLPKNE